jgi:hypothetical protein
MQVGDTVMLYMLDGLLTWTAHSEPQQVWAGPSWSSYALQVRSLLLHEFRLNPLFDTTQGEGWLWSMLRSCATAWVLLPGSTYTTWQVCCHITTCGFFQRALVERLNVCICVCWIDVNHLAGKISAISQSSHHQTKEKVWL